MRRTNIRRRNYNTGPFPCQLGRLPALRHASAAAVFAVLCHTAATSIRAQPDSSLAHSTYTEHFFIYYGEGRFAEARAMEKVAEECWQAVAAELGLAPSRRIHLKLAGSLAELEELCGGPEDFRLAGRARADRPEIVLRLRGSARQRRAVLAHELVHIALGQALEPHGVLPPQWLTEGLAEYVADLVTDGQQRRIASGEPISLSDLHAGFPADPDRSDLAYAQSCSFVAFVIAETDDRSLRRLVQALRETGDVEDAFVQAYGRTLADFEMAWRPRFTTRSGRWFRSDPDLAIFMAMGALFIIVCVLRIIRGRRRRREDEMEEALNQLRIGGFEDDE